MPYFRPDDWNRLMKVDRGNLMTLLEKKPPPPVPPEPPEDVEMRPPTLEEFTRWDKDLKRPLLSTWLDRDRGALIRQRQSELAKSPTWEPSGIRPDERDWYQRMVARANWQVGEAVRKPFGNLASLAVGAPGDPAIAYALMWGLPIKPVGKGAWQLAKGAAKGVGKKGAGKVLPQPVVSPKATSQEVAKEAITPPTAQPPKLLPVGVTKEPIVVPPTSVSISHLLKRADEAIAETELLRKAERARRVGRGASALKAKEGSEAWRAALSAQKGKMPQKGVELAGTENDVNLMLESVREAVNRKTIPFYSGINARAGLMKLFSAEVPEESEVKILKQVFGEDIQKLVDKVAKSPDAWDKAMDLLNMPRLLLLGAFDASAVLLQAGKFLPRHFKEWGISTGRGLKSAALEKWARNIDDAMKTHPQFDEITSAMDMYIAPNPWRMTKTALREETFYSRTLQKLPIVGYPFRFAERGFVATLNSLRWSVGKLNYDIMKKMGAEDWEFKQMGHLINELTGRGTTNAKVAAVMPALSGLLMAPRLYLSKMQAPRHIFSRSKAVRQEMWSTIASYMGARVAFLSLLTATGIGTVELDPRSSDWGKLKIGNTRLDIWTGDLQWLRFLVQYFGGHRKAADGKIKEANRGDTALRFGRTKLNPITAFITDLSYGSTIIGEDLEPTVSSIGKQAYNRLVQIAVQDAVDAVQEWGGWGVLAFAPAFFGMGVQTYESDKRTPSTLKESIQQGKNGKGSQIQWGTIK